jgi:hypothetical protein
MPPRKKPQPSKPADPVPAKQLSPPKSIEEPSEPAKQPIETRPSLAEPKQIAETRQPPTQEIVNQNAQTNVEDSGKTEEHKEENGKVISLTQFNMFDAGAKSLMSEEEKRKLRKERFKLVDEDKEKLKLLERKKKFGMVDWDEEEAKKKKRQERFLGNPLVNNLKKK